MPFSVLPQISVLSSARRTRSGRMLTHLTRLCLGITFKYHKLRKFVSKNDIFFGKLEMPILFPVNCQRTNLISV